MDVKAAQKVACDDQHDEWYERRAAPRIRLLMLSIIGASLGTISTVLFFVISAKINEHTLATNNQMISRHEFESTVGRIEKQIEKLDTSVTASVTEISDKLDRNWRDIQRANANAHSSSTR